MMTRQEKINTIRAACLRANPEIMELKFGCEVKIKPGSRFHHEMRKHYGTSFVMNDRCLVNDISHISMVAFLERADDYEIIGRTIRLADVLLAARNLIGGRDNRSSLLVLDDGFFGLTICSDEFDYAENGAQWNLRTDDLAQQSDECIDFLSELLTPTQ